MGPAQGRWQDTCDAVLPFLGVASELQPSVKDRHMGGHDHLIGSKHADAGPDGARRAVIHPERDCVLDDRHTRLYASSARPAREVAGWNV